MLIQRQTTGKYGDFRRRLVLRMRPDDIELVMSAYELSKEAHRGQFRDGKKVRYFDHLRETALILLDLDVSDPDIIISSLLHDAIEDNPGFMSRGAIESIFNSRVADIVMMVTKPKKTDTRFESDAERHRFYFIRLAEANDDVLLVKLADRLHNMRTLKTCAPKKRIRKSNETVDVYLLLCEKLALHYPAIGEYFHTELENLANGFLNPKPKPVGKKKVRAKK